MQIVSLISALKIFFIIHRFEVSNFGSLYFLLFLLASVLLYYLFRKSSLVLLLSGIVFYLTYSVQMTEFVLLLAFVNYLGGIALSRKKSRLLLLVLILFDAGSLIYYKYANFFIENLHALSLAKKFDSLTYIVIPLGISFFTFETIHYLVDIYHGKKPVKNSIHFFSFIFFYPTLIAGPIKRFEGFIPQVKKPRLNYSLITGGILLLIRGLFKKIVIANTVANIASYGFGGTNNSLLVLLGVYAFSFQIYFDFSGYTDIARGSAALFGIKIPENFLSPYLSKNVSDFWRRWHISLMQWLRDYIYIPLGGSRVGKIRHTINLLIVFFLSGLWHGAGWHFIFWGVYNGILVVFSNFFTQIQSLFRNKKISTFFGIFLTFHLITIGWVFFRASNMTEAWQIIRSVLTRSTYRTIPSELTLKLMSISIVLITYALLPFILSRVMSKKKYTYARYALYSFAFLLALLCMQIDYLSFIYFQF